jgi:hypothetical protein
VAKVMQSSQEATPLSIDFPGQHLEALPNGSILIRQGDETGEPIGTIDPAWAKEANGADVATSFTVNGSTLTQSVSPGESTTYPLVADPRVRQAWHGWPIPPLVRGDLIPWISPCYS